MPDSRSHSARAAAKATLIAQLPPGIRSRQIDNGNGLNMHILEAGYESSGRECVLLLHGFPELAYTWRKVMLPLAEAGYQVVAPDQRGYGMTEGSDMRYEGDVSQYRLLNLVRDALGLIFALGHKSVAAVVGHDIGSPVAATCALTRPDVFRSVALMSAPYPGASSFRFDGRSAAEQAAKVHQDLAALNPPRLHYQRYLCLYYVMAMDKTMPQTVAQAMPTAEQVSACAWLPDKDLAVYALSFAATGFQGGLQWYRAFGSAASQAELLLFAGLTISVPACFIAGASDWGIYQSPGAFEAMQSLACSDLRSCNLIPDAGHWVQQEQPEVVVDKLLAFLAGMR